MIVDLFAGPGGWSEGLRLLAPDLHALEIGFEWDKAACETRNAAGHRTVRTDVAEWPLEPLAGKVVGVIASPPCQDFSLAGKRAGIDGDRGQLITEVVRWIETLQPEWFACEQVPPALPIWRDYADHFRSLGWSTWCGILNAADYGVPQTRRRAFLIGSRTRTVTPPKPTHDRDPMPTLFGDDLSPWVSMADALGWGRTESAWTLCAGTHGAPDPFLSGGQSLRISLIAEIDAGEWIPKPARLESVTDIDDASDEPAPPEWSVNTGRRWVKGGTREDAQTVPAPAPAPTVSGQTHAWRFTRPATTLVGSFRPDIVAGPGVDLTRPRQKGGGGVRITQADALVLQSFPADYPVQGSKTKQFEQIGNAVPPLLAAHVLAVVTGRSLELLNEREAA